MDIKKLIVGFLFISFAAVNLQGQETKRFIIKTKSEFPLKTLKSSLNLRESAELNSIFRELNLYSLEIPVNEVKQLMQMERLSFIEYIAEDILLEYRNTPNDPFFPKQYAMEIINAIDVWSNHIGGVTGSGDTIVIAVLDRGMDISHIDLNANIWRNWAEIPGNGIDDDGNGYIDDFMGVDMDTKTGKLYKDNHGTSVAGIIGAVGNNKTGITGINWNVKILPITSVRLVSQVIEGYQYIYDMRKFYNDSNGNKGAFIVATNLSAGYSKAFPDDSPALLDWCNMYNILGTQGILSVSAADNNQVNVEEEGDMPSLCTSDFLIPVTSTTREDRYDDRRAFGIQSIDIAAPGQDIYTLQNDDAYRIAFSGNSAAAPMVAAAIGLLYTIPCKGFADKILANPAELGLKIKEYILDNSDKLPDLADRTVSGGRLNIYSTYINMVNDLCGELPVGKDEIISIGPNPASDLITVEYDVENYGEITMSIYDARGRLILTDKFRPGIFGVKTRTFNVSGFPTAVYFLSMLSANKRVSRAFHVLGK